MTARPIRRVLAATLSAVLALGTPAAGATTIAIVGATVHTLGPQGTLDKATVIIEDGRIRAVGRRLAVPAGARAIDAAGKVVTPGIFDPYSRLGLVEISLVEETVDNAQVGERFTASFDVADAVNPRSTLIPVNRIEGVTRAMVAPGPAEGGSVISGQGAVISLGDAADFLLARGAALFVTLGERGAALAGGSRVEALLRLREALEDAADYADNRGAWQDRARRDYAVGRLDLDALQPVLAGRTPVVVRVDRASDIEAALRLALDFGLKLVIAGGAEAWMVAPQLAEAGVPVIIDPTFNLPQRFEALGATMANAARLHAAGVKIAFATADEHNPRNLKQLAGNAVAHGLPWEEALRAITVNGAAIYGQNASYGTLEPGQDADVVVWSGDPLEVTTFADQVFIRGEEVPMRSRQTLLRDRYRDLDGPLPPAYRKP